MQLADYICERASIGQVVVSTLEPEKDPDLIPELQALSDAEFEKEAIKLNAQRDVFAFGTLVSLNYNIIKKKKQQFACFQQIMKYVLKKAELHCSQY
jgi:hypothetical protein